VALEGFRTDYAPTLAVKHTLARHPLPVAQRSHLFAARNEGPWLRETAEIIDCATRLWDFTRLLRTSIMLPCQCLMRKYRFVQ